ncbi:hypothetical protein ACQ86D_51240 [Streptomyces galilaeus]
MSDVAENHAAVLMITVWFEPGCTDLRARITRTTDVRVPGRSVVVSDRDAILANVREWLDTWDAEPRG